MLEHFCVKFGDPSCSGFWVIMQETVRQTNATEISPPVTSVGVVNETARNQFTAAALKPWANN